MENNTSKLNTILLVILVVFAAIIIFLLVRNQVSKSGNESQMSTGDIAYEKDSENMPLQNQDNAGLEWVKIFGNNYGSTYSFSAPKTWISNPVTFDGCVWGNISLPSDGHYMRGEVSIYPKSCFDISKNPSLEYTEKDGYYITVSYGNNPAEIQEAKLVYQKVIQTFQVDKNTYIYKKHGFTIELPKGYVPNEYESEGGPYINIQLPQEGHLIYIANMDFWNKWALSDYSYLRDQKIGTTTFKVYTAKNSVSNQNETFYLFSQGNVGFMFSGNMVEYMKTFKFVGWN